MPQESPDWLVHAAESITKGDSPDAVVRYVARRAGDEAAFDERLRIAQFVADNQDTLKEFAGAGTAEMLAYMLRELRPDEVPA